MDCSGGDIINEATGFDRKKEALLRVMTEQVWPALPCFCCRLPLANLSFHILSYICHAFFQALMIGFLNIEIPVTLDDQDVLLILAL